MNAMPRGLGNSSRNDRPKGACHPKWKTAPHLNLSTIAWMVGAHFANHPAANVVLPNGGMRLGTPLGFKAAGTAFGARAAEVEGLLAAIDGSREQMPIHQHIG